MKKPQKLLYLEHYPHYGTGIHNTKAEFDTKVLRELDKMPENEFDETALQIAPKAFAFREFIKTEDADKVLRAVRRKGWWVGLWEEGTYGVCFPQFEKKCIGAIAKLEAKLSGDFEFGFE